MRVSRITRNITLTLLVFLIIFAGAAFAGWNYVTHRIARNARAPHLERISEQMIDFPFRGLNGEPRLLADTKGKIVFLDLWGTWCIQCVAEMPTVQALYQHYRDDPNVVFLMVSRLDSPEAVRRYAHLNHYDLPFYTTDDSDIPGAMQLNQFPATFVYAPDGSMAVKHTGAADWSAPSVIAFIDGLKRTR